MAGFLHTQLGSKPSTGMRCCHSSFTRRSSRLPLSVVAVDEAPGLAEKPALRPPPKPRPPPPRRQPSLPPRNQNQRPDSRPYTGSREPNGTPDRQQDNAGPPRQQYQGVSCAAAATDSTPAFVADDLASFLCCLAKCIRHPGSLHTGSLTSAWPVHCALCGALPWALCVSAAGPPSTPSPNGTASSNGAAPVDLAGRPAPPIQRPQRPPPPPRYMFGGTDHIALPATLPLAEVAGVFAPRCLHVLTLGHHNPKEIGSAAHPGTHSSKEMTTYNLTQAATIGSPAAVPLGRW